MINDTNALGVGFEMQASSLVDFSQLSSGIVITHDGYSHTEEAMQIKKEECPNEEHSCIKLSPTLPWCGRGGGNTREKVSVMLADRMHGQGRNN